MSTPLQSLSSDLTNISKQKAPWFIRFGYLCINREVIPVWFATTCLICSYLQILGLMIKTIMTRLRFDLIQVSSFFETFYKIATISDFLDYTKQSAINNLIFGISSIYILSILVTCILLIYKLIKKRDIPNRLRILWGFFCYIHPLVIFFPFHCLSLQMAY